MKRNNSTSRQAVQGSDEVDHNSYHTPSLSGDKTAAIGAGTPTRFNMISAIAQSSSKPKTVPPMTIPPITLIPSSGSYSLSSSRGSPMSMSSRPTKDETSALWEIMSTPPENYKIYSQDKRGDSKRTRSLSPSNISHPYTLSSLVSPKSISSNNSHDEAPSSLYGPPYESSQPHKPTTSSPISSPSLSPASGTRFPLQPRSFRSLANRDNVPLSRNCRHYGLGPDLSVLPESMIYSIMSYIDYFDRHPTILLVSHGMTKLLTNPAFMFELKHARVPSINNHHCHSEEKKSLLSQLLDEGDAVEENMASNEMLLVVGGKCPTKVNNNSNTNENSRVTSALQTLDEGRVNRRMAMQNNEHTGIMGYDQRRESWVRFGGDPLKPFISNSDTAAASLSSPIDATLHPLSPFGIVDSKPLFIGHPYYCLMFFGGTHHETGTPSSRVIAYSFLFGRWEHWSGMMRARHAEDFVVARVDGSQDKIGSDGVKQEGTLQPHSCDDSVVLIGCDLELCDCFRCNPPSGSSDRNRNPDMDINMMSCVSNEHRNAGMAAGNCHLYGAQNRNREDLNTMGRCEVLDLKSRRWERRKSKAPSCPPDDGGVAVVEGRFVYLPGTCPPPPSTITSLSKTTHKESSASGENGVAATALSQSEINSHADRPKSASASSMDTESESFGDNGVASSPLGNLFRSLSYRPGLRYDCWLDRWDTLPARPYVTTSSPTTCAFNDGTRDCVIVLGGYRSSSENALSCYRHREEDSILDYEDHLDYAWWYIPSEYSPSHKTHGKSGEDVLEQNTENYFTEMSDDNSGEWTFGGGTTMFGHRQAWAHSDEMAAAVAAASILKGGMSNDASIPRSCNLPCGAPVPVRGAAATTYQGRLTMLGGLSTFSRTFYDSERKAIWQFFPEHREWRRVSMTLHVPALLDGYAFSLYI